MRILLMACQVTLTLLNWKTRARLRPLLGREILNAALVMWGCWLTIGWFIDRPTWSAPAQAMAQEPSPESARRVEEAQGGDRVQAKAGDVRVLGRLAPFELTNQDGRAFGTKDLLGKIWIANFIFTRCTATCPVQTTLMAKLQDDSRKSPDLNDVRFVSFSVDPAYDRPEILLEYGRQYRADPTRWTFLTGARETLWQISKQGFKLDVGENPGNAAMPLFHSPKVVLVDRTGHVRGYFDGTSEDGLNALQRDLKKVVVEPTLLPVPETVRTSPWVEKRRAAQLRTLEKFHVFHNFSFADELEASGIQFHHQVVPDAGKHYKAAHYDHGNGLAIADVDRDGLLDVYFSTQVGANELWRNFGGGTFENITVRAGVGLPGRIGVSASFADTDNDGDSDLFATSVRGGNALFLNDGAGNFTDATAAAGLGYSGHSSGAVFFDFDLDGRLDLFLTNVGKYTSDDVRQAKERTTGKVAQYYVAFKDAFGGHLKPERREQSILYRNLGQNRFRDVSQELNLVDTGWCGDASPIDVNEDGWPDLYTLNMQGSDEYYENDRGTRFVKKSRQVFPKTPWGSMGIKVFDYNNDGRLDLFLSDMHSDMFDQRLFPSTTLAGEKQDCAQDALPSQRYLRDGESGIYSNAFFEKQHGDSYVDVTDRINAENYWPWGVSVGDLNADGYEDVFLSSSMNYPFRYAVNSVLLNDRGTEFLDSEFILGVEPRRGQRFSIPWFELDCSGADRGHLRCRGLGGRVVVEGALGSRAAVIFDLDNDGDLDIITNDFNSPPMVLINNLTEAKRGVRFLKIILVGTTSNRDGLGAEVRIKVGNRTLTRVHDGQSGYLSQSSYPLYFGLDEAELVEKVEVTWPSRRATQSFFGVASNQTIEITEGKKEFVSRKN